MAASALVPDQIIRTSNGLLVELEQANADGNYFDNSTNPYLEVLNGGGSPITVYAAVYADGLTIVQGRSWSIGAGERRKIGRFASNYVDPATSRVNITYSGVTDVDVGLFY